MKTLLLSLTILLGLFTGVAAQDQPKVFVAPMEAGFNEFLTAALIKQKVPIQLVISDETADFVIKGTSIKGDSKWYDTVFGSEKDRNQASVTLLKVSDKSIAWAASAGDKSFWNTPWSKGGQRKVADRLAKSLKKEYFNGKPKKS